MGGHGQVPPALRRFGLYERISDRPRLARGARDAHLRRHERDYEGTDRAEALRTNPSPSGEGQRDLVRRSRAFSRAGWGPSALRNLDSPHTPPPPAGEGLSYG